MTDKSPVTYVLEGSIATITLDDGRANLMTDAMMQAIDEALDRAENDRAVVLLAGRERTFSGGYDLTTFAREPAEVIRTIRAGGKLAERLYGFPYPVVAACTGNAVAQGAFTLLASDVRIGAIGPFKIGLNEVVIGLTIPLYGVELARSRLATPWLHHATVTGTLYPPETALAAGFFDRLVEPAQVLAVAREEAQKLTSLDMVAHAATKHRVRGAALARMHQGIDGELPANGKSSPLFALTSLRR